MLTKRDIKALEKKYKFFPQKRLGQNFLIDAAVKDKLLGCVHIDRGDTVLEIGSGLGQLTFDLAKKAKKVIAVEFDRKLFNVLSVLAKDFSNIVLAHEDFLKFDLKEFAPKGRRIKVISNLPYYISSPVILKLFAHSDYVSAAVLTLQREVADRLSARPCSKEYGSITVFAEFHSEVKRLFNISRNCFYPAPKVDSTVCLLDMRSAPPVSVGDKKDLFNLVRAGFSMRRKTLLNAVASQGYEGLTKKQLESVLRSAEIPVNARAETLALEDFARILNAIR